jgi:cytochrome c oxidase subunit 3
LANHDSHAAHGHDGHGHHGPHSDYPFLAHHFDTPNQQFESGKLGMWLFLATEVLFFGALFVLYAVMRFKDPQVFSYASQYLDTILGGINTCVLILSSLTMAIAVRAAQTNKRGLLIGCLALTLAGAIGFLVIKYFEYSHKFHLNLKWSTAFYEPTEDVKAVVTTEPTPVPNATLAIASPNPSQGASGDPLAPLPPVDRTAIVAPKAGPSGVVSLASLTEQAMAAGSHGGGGDHEDAHHDKAHLSDPDMPVGTHRFFAIYYAMTGLHGIHVLIGVGVIGWLLINAIRGVYSNKYFTQVDLVGLYWHVVDLVWIFLFPLFYLIH